jgi:hypothetical protein
MVGCGVVTGVVKDAVGWEVRREGSGDGGAKSMTGGLVFAVRRVRVNDGRLDRSGWEERVVHAGDSGVSAYVESEKWINALSTSSRVITPSLINMRCHSI